MSAETGPPFFVERMTHSQIKRMMLQRDELIKKTHRLTAQNAALEEALEFYGESENYKIPAGQPYHCLCNVCEDDGKTARTALEKR